MPLYIPSASIILADISHTVSDVLLSLHFYADFQDGRQKSQKTIYTNNGQMTFQIGTYPPDQNSG